MSASRSSRRRTYREELDHHDDYDELIDQEPVKRMTRAHNHNLRSRVHQSVADSEEDMESYESDELESDEENNEEIETNPALKTRLGSPSGKRIKRRQIPDHGAPRTQPHTTDRDERNNVHRNLGIDEPDQQIRARKSSNYQSIARLLILGSITAIIALFLVLRSGNVSSQCENGMSIPAQDLRRELNVLGDFSSSFDVYDFIALFQHRIIGRPTVVHIVSTSEKLPRRTVEWLMKKQPCAGSLLLPADLGNFIERSGALAKKYESAAINPETCRVIFTVLLKNSHFDKKNRDWLESVIDDTRPFAYTDRGQIDTNDWCVIFLDHWSGEYAQQTEGWTKLEPAQVDQQIRDLTAPLWTTRFYQRVQGIFFI
jgi:hypothetical protein